MLEFIPSNRMINYWVFPFESWCIFADVDIWGNLRYFVDYEIDFFKEEDEKEEEKKLVLLLFRKNWNVSNNRRTVSAIYAIRSNKGPPSLNGKPCV